MEIIIFAQRSVNTNRSGIIIFYILSIFTPDVCAFLQKHFFTEGLIIPWDSF